MSGIAKNDPGQMVFPVFMPVVSNLGNGTFKVELGKPLLWLKPGQFAANFDVDRDTVYRWIKEGTLPLELTREDKSVVVFVEKAGKRKLRINAAAVPWLKKKFKEELATEEG